MKTRICFIRHGETDWNVDKRIQGQIDTPLNLRGLAQAQSLSMLCKEHNFAAIYCSDLSRARETALQLAACSDLHIRATPALRERHFGIFQGLTASLAAAQFPDAYAHYKNRDPDYDFLTGESLGALQARVSSFLSEIDQAHRNQTIAVVTHAGVLDIVYRQATGKSLSAPRDFVIANCALNWFCMNQSGLQLERWAEQVASSATLATFVE